MTIENIKRTDLINSILDTLFRDGSISDELRELMRDISHEEGDS